MTVHARAERALMIGPMRAELAANQMNAPKDIVVHMLDGLSLDRQRKLLALSTVTSMPARLHRETKYCTEYGCV